MDCIYVGKMIKEGRKRENLTQKELGEKLHVSDKAVSKWERGMCYPDITLLDKISKELNIPINEILTNEDKQNIKRRNCYSRIVIVCLVFMAIGLGGTILYLGNWWLYTHLRRSDIFYAVVVYLVLFVGAVLITWWREMRK